MGNIQPNDEFKSIIEANEYIRSTYEKYISEKYTCNIGIELDILSPIKMYNFDKKLEKFDITISIMRCGTGIVISLILKHYDNKYWVFNMYIFNKTLYKETLIDIDNFINIIENFDININDKDLILTNEFITITYNHIINDERKIIINNDTFLCPKQCHHYKI